MLVTEASDHCARTDTITEHIKTVRRVLEFHIRAVQISMVFNKGKNCVNMIISLIQVFYVINFRFLAVRHTNRMKSLLLKSRVPRFVHRTSQAMSSVRNTETCFSTFNLFTYCLYYPIFQSL